MNTEPQLSSTRTLPFNERTSLLQSLLTLINCTLLTPVLISGNNEHATPCLLFLPSQRLRNPSKTGHALTTGPSGASGRDGFPPARRRPALPGGAPACADLPLPASPSCPGGFPLPSLPSRRIPASLPPAPEDSSFPLSQRPPGPATRASPAGGSGLARPEKVYPAGL